MQLLQNIVIGFLIFLGAMVFLYLCGYMLISGALTGWENFLKRKQSINKKQN